MYSVLMRLGLVQLFEAISGKIEDALLPGTGRSETCDQGELFGGLENKPEYFPSIKEKDIAIAVGMHMETGINFSVLPSEILGFYELSADAFGAIVYAWMSELPVTGQIIRFGKKILAAKDAITSNTGPARRGKLEAAQRKAAVIAATDRGDLDVQTVRETAYKVWHEIHRLMGLLRFCPDENGVYTAQCEPDHFVLPALGPHFMERFGETSWVIIDNKRRLIISCKMGRIGASEGEPRLSASAVGNCRTLVLSKTAENPVSFGKGQGGEWESLWKHYHKTINNESRNNSDLQKRFMPTRYWKYLTEF